MTNDFEQPAPRGQRLRQTVLRGLMRAGFKQEHFLTILSIAIGSATGLGAYGFYRLIDETHALCYGHGESMGWFRGLWWMLLLMPAVGGMATGLIVHFFAREAKGHGVPEVMDAILRQGGTIRPRVALAKAVASACTIGSGGSAGTEGPIVQIGSAIGSTFGQLLRIPKSQMNVLVACGAAAGISAIFNAPIAGVLFALEIFLRDFSLRTFAPVVFASVLSSSVTHALLGVDRAIFAMPSEGYIFSGLELPYYLLLGVVCAVGGVGFVRSLYKTEDLFDALKFPEYLKPVIGSTGLGILGVAAFFAGSGGAPHFFGNGYPFIQHALSPDLVNEAAHTLLMFWILKTVATCLTLGSGGSGGVFAPSLFMGATLGGAFGLVLYRFGLVDQGSIPAYALVGMAAMVAATTHAPLTAIVILFEITHNYRVILPVMFAAIVATTGAQLLLSDSIYTLKLSRRGVRVGRLADLTILRRIVADQVKWVRPCRVRADDPLQKLLDMAGDHEAYDFVVTDENGAYLGMVTGADIRTALLQPEAIPLLLVGELMRTDVPRVHPKETLDSVMDKFAHVDAYTLPVTELNDDTQIRALITQQNVMIRYYAELD